MNKVLSLSLLLLSLAFFSAEAQERDMQKANKKFQQYAFVDSQQLYLKVANEGYESADLFGKLGDAFYFNADYAEAAQWYAKLVEKFPSETTPDQLFRYAQALRAEENYDLSKKYLTQYNERVADGEVYDSTVVAEARKGYMRGTYTVEKAGINSKGYSDFSPAYYGEKLLFASTRDTGTYTTRVHKWNEQPFLDFYTADLNDGKASNPQKLQGKINTPYHESSAVLSADGSTLYFTRNNYTKEQYKESKSGTNKLKIYQSKKDADGKWSEAEEVSFDSDDYTVAHPALSPDGKTMYFASDMPGSLGQSDLWKVAINDDGSFGIPQNLGSKVNTPGRENFPYVSANGNIYFSTDGRPGLGGLDVYVIDAQTNTMYNVGEPINSEKDDFSFIINEEDNTGFFATNRSNDPLDDDIYGFIKTGCESIVNITVIDKVSKEPLPGATVGIRDINNDLVESGEAVAPDALYVFDDPDCGSDYFARAEMEGYNTAEKHFMVPDTSTELNVTIELEPSVTEIPPGFDIGKLLNPILFDFDKSNIRPDAAVELAKVIEVLKEYPTLKIDVRSHTDSRGSDSYNLALSQRRNDSTIKYIIEKGGISPDRVTGRGYGETQLVNECSNGVDCSAAQHQLNRRSEFIVMED